MVKKDANGVFWIDCPNAETCVQTWALCEVRDITLPDGTIVDYCVCDDMSGQVACNGYVPQGGGDPDCFVGNCMPLDCKKLNNVWTWTPQIICGCR